MKLDEDEGKELAEHLSKFANRNQSGTLPTDVFITSITRDHRTIQQNIGRLLIGLIQAWADEYEEGRVDARNEAICKFSARVIRNTEPEDRMLPHI